MGDVDSISDRSLNKLNYSCGNQITIAYFRTILLWCKGVYLCCYRAAWQRRVRVERESTHWSRTGFHVSKTIKLTLLCFIDSIGIEVDQGRPCSGLKDTRAAEITSIICDILALSLWYYVFANISGNARLRCFLYCRCSVWKIIV